MGIGFAIPVSTAKQVLDSIVKEGQVTRGWIGVEPSNLTAELAETFDVKIKEGVIITGVLRNGPAAEGGIRPGDVIVRIADQPVKDVGQLLALVAALKPKESAKFTVVRKGERLEMTITPGMRPKPQAQ